MFCCTLLYVHSSIAIILIGKRELVALLNVSSWCLVMVEWLFLAVPWGCLRFVSVVIPDHAHLLFIIEVSMIRKYHNHKLQTNTCYRKEEPHNNHETPARQSKANSSLFHIRDDCKTRMETK